MATQLTGSTQPLSLGEGYSIRAPGLRGTAELRRPRPEAERARSRIAEDGTDALDAALRNSNITEVRQIDLSLIQTTGGESSRSLRSTDGQEMLELQVPDLGPDTGQLILTCDESGVLTWHLPLEDQQDGALSTARGSGHVKRFMIPATRLGQTEVEETGKRGLLGVLGKKLCKVLIYPILDPVVGKISEIFAERWEEKNRPYGLRTFTPGNFRDADVPALSDSDWQRLAGGRALLFIHGTFSTAHSAFSEIPDNTFEALYQYYGGRVFAFNHYSLSHDPKRNVDWLLKQIPAGKSLEVDIVCHSRGGLVARTLAKHSLASGSEIPPMKVGRIVFVGVPNSGTPLAHADHMVKMLDRLTTALNIFPTGPVTETLEAILCAVKVIGHGALNGLDGLLSMRPGGEFLNQLNTGSEDGNEYFAVAADFEPVDDGLKALVAGSIADTVVDRVFEKAPNDLVVPELGVYSTNGSQLNIYPNNVRNL